jgi:hypothetical protein
MASGDTILESTNMYLASDEAEVGHGTTQFQHSTNGVVVVIQKGNSGVQETIFDASKNYDVIVKEH